MRTIGGIAYQELTATTLEMDAAVMREVRSLGIETFEKAEGETQEEFVERIITTLIEGGQAFRLLGCFLVPDGKQWSRQQATESADLFRASTDPNDKAQLRAVLVPYLFAFFVVGLTYGTTSRKFSAMLRKVFLGQPVAAEQSTSASGTSLQKSSQGATLGKFRKWLAGLFAMRS